MMEELDRQYARIFRACLRRYPTDRRGPVPALPQGPRDVGPRTAGALHVRRRAGRVPRRGRGRPGPRLPDVRRLLPDVPDGFLRTRLEAMRMGDLQDPELRARLAAYPGRGPGSRDLPRQAGQVLLLRPLRRLPVPEHLRRLPGLHRPPAGEHGPAPGSRLPVRLQPGFAETPRAIPLPAGRAGSGSAKDRCPRSFAHASALAPPRTTTRRKPGRRPEAGTW